MQKPQSPFFTISIVNDEEVIRFHDNDFRAFMYLNYRLFEDLLYRDGDSSVVKKEKDKNFLPFNDILNKIVVSVTSRYSHQLEDYVKDPLIEKILLSKRYSQVHEDEIDDSETSEDVRKKYLDLHEDHKASAVSLVFYATSCAYKDLLAAIQKFNKNEGLSVGEALHVFKHFARKETPLLICVNSGVNIVSKIFDVELRQYGMSQAIKYCHYVSLHNGNSFVSIGKTVYVPIWSGTMLPSEIGLSLPSEKDVSETLNRAEAYIDITKNGQKYLHYTGQMSYKQGWMVRKFNATGRVVVDYRGMKEMCPNYYGFFPFGGGSDDESNSVGTNTPTEVMKLNMSPYVYGFSLKNKHWGEFNVASFSPIVFRDDAYDKLVLDGGTKGLIRALVDSGMSSGPDLIDNKGGGCIFLLEGPPGVGRLLTALSV